MFCRNCGTQWPEETVFCGKCGTALKVAEPAPQPVEEAPAPVEEPAPAEPSAEEKLLAEIRDILKDK